jgi:hypothetical protein
MQTPFPGIGVKIALLFQAAHNHHIVQFMADLGVNTVSLL